jgi:hypothetical protein
MGIVIARESGYSGIFSISHGYGNSERVLYVRVLWQVFSEHLDPAGKGALKSADAGGADDVHERKAAAQVKLWK